MTSVSLFRLCMRTPLPSLRVTFDDITSGQKAPLGWILCNFRLRIPKGTPFGALPVALSVMCTFCTTTIVVVQNVPVVHVHAITSSSGLQLQLQSGYLVTSASRHLTKDYIYTRAQQSLKV